MREFFLGLLGCAILFGIPAFAVFVVMRFHRRLSDLEAQLRSLQSSVDRLSEQPSASQQASVSQQAPAVSTVDPYPIVVDRPATPPATITSLPKTELPPRLLPTRSRAGARA